jgi:hypothetical protein
MDGWNEALVADVDVDIGGFERRLHIYHNLGQPGDEGGFVNLREENDGGWVGVTGITTDDLRGTHDVAVLDIDNDGDNDLIISRNGGTFTWESSVDPVTCQEDRGFGGPGGETLSVCGTPLGTGGSAQLQMTGAEPFAVSILLVAFSDTQSLNVPFGVNTVTPALFKVQFANGVGTKQFPITGGSGENGVIQAYLQYLVANSTSGSPEGWSATNVIELELEE